MTPTFSREHVESAQRAKAARAGKLAGLQVTKRVSRATPKEREIQRAILDYLKLVPGVVAWRNNASLTVFPAEGTHKRRVIRGSEPGISDIIGWKDESLPLGRTARFLAIEVKRPGKDPSDAQQAFLDQVKAAGGIAIVARSVHDVQQALRP